MSTTHSRPGPREAGAQTGEPARRGPSAGDREDALSPGWLQLSLNGDERAPARAAGDAPGDPGGGGASVDRWLGRGEPLSPATRAEFEPRLGLGLGAVRVHTGERAARSAAGLRARAYALEDHLVFGAGAFAPERPAGRRLLAHELGHVAEHAAGAPRGIRRQLLTSTAPGTPQEAESALPARPDRPGHDIVLMSGGPVSNREDREHDDNPLNYVTAARIRIQHLIESAFGDQRQMTPRDRITWLVMRPPYRYRALEDGKGADEYLNLLTNGSLPARWAEWNRLAAQAQARDGGTIPRGEDVIRLRFIDSSQEFVDVLNEGAFGERATLPVGRFEYFGHGTPGTLWFQMGWTHLRSRDITFTTDDIDRLDPGAFVHEGEYRSWSCNTATPQGNGQETFVSAWVSRLGGRFVGARGRTTYEFILNPAENPRGWVLVSREEDARWLTTTAVGAAEPPPVERRPEPEPVAPTAPVTPLPGYVHDSELPPEGTEPPVTPAPATPAAAPDAGVSLPDAGPVSVDAGVSEATGAAELAPEEMVCRAEVVPLDEPAYPGELVCADEGAGLLDLGMCAPGGDAAAVSAPPPDLPPGTAGEFHPVHEVGIDAAESLFAPDPDDPAWDAFLRDVIDRTYRETLDVDSVPGTAYALRGVGSEAVARSRGFYIGVVERNGRTYYKIYGSRGAHAGIRGRWYSAANLRAASPVLNQMVNPRAGLGAGLRSGSVGIGGALTVVGTTLDYAVDPEKDFGSDFAVDLSLDLVKSAGASAAAGAAGAAATGWLAGGALGATIGSAAPVVGTIIGFAVGVIAAVAIEYFLEDFRASLKAALRHRHDIRSDRGGAGRGREEIK